MEKVFLKIGTFAAAIASCIGVYFLFIQPIVLTVTLGSVTAEKLETAEVRMHFSNEGRNSLRITEAELFFTKAEDCTGVQLSRELLQIGDKELPGPIGSGEKADLFSIIPLNLENEVRYTLCGAFEVFTGKRTIRKERIALTELTTIWNEFDGSNLSREAIDLVRIHEFNWF